jgi:hypothetical protein
MNIIIWLVSLPVKLFFKVINFGVEEVKCGEDSHVFRYDFDWFRGEFNNRPIADLPCQCGEFKDYKTYQTFKFKRSIRNLYREGKSFNVKD